MTKIQYKGTGPGLPPQLAVATVSVDVSQMLPFRTWKANVWGYFSPKPSRFVEYTPAELAGGPSCLRPLC